MRSPPTLALCIPTFRRPQCLRVLLESVVIQDPPFSEVIVSDDYSMDDTPGVVGSFSSLIPNLRYHQCSENGGLDQNYRTVVGLATSEFVWLMGDDDRLRPGATLSFYQEHEQSPQLTGLTFASIDYDSRLEKPTGLKAFPTRCLAIGASQLFSEYIDLIGFMSTTVISRKSWDSISPESKGPFDNLYSQVHRIGKMMGNNGRWLISDHIAVDYRSDNDQFKAALGGELKRMMRDVEAYSTIVDDLFSDDETTAFWTLDRVLRTHIISRVQNGKIDRGYPWLSAIRALAPFYYRHPFFWIRVIPTLLAPSSALALVRYAYRRLSPSSGATRARELSRSTA